MKFFWQNASNDSKPLATDQKKQESSESEDEFFECETEVVPIQTSPQ